MKARIEFIVMISSVVLGALSSVLVAARPPWTYAALLVLSGGIVGLLLGRFVVKVVAPPKVADWNLYLLHEVARNKVLGATVRITAATALILLVVASGLLGFFAGMFFGDRFIV